MLAGPGGVQGASNKKILPTGFTAREGPLAQASKEIVQLDLRPFLNNFRSSADIHSVTGQASLPLVRYLVLCRGMGRVEDCVGGPDYPLLPNFVTG